MTSEAYVVSTSYDIKRAREVAYDDARSAPSAIYIYKYVSRATYGTQRVAPLYEGTGSIGLRSPHPPTLRQLKSEPACPLCPQAATDREGGRDWEPSGACFPCLPTGRASVNPFQALGTSNDVRGQLMLFQRAYVGRHKKVNDFLLEFRPLAFLHCRVEQSSQTKCTFLVWLNLSSRQLLEETGSSNTHPVAGKRLVLVWRRVDSVLRGGTGGIDRWIASYMMFYDQWPAKGHIRAKQNVLLSSSLLLLLSLLLHW